MGATFSPHTQFPGLNQKRSALICRVEWLPREQLARSRLHLASLGVPFSGSRHPVACKGDFWSVELNEPLMTGCLDPDLPMSVLPTTSKSFSAADSVAISRPPAFICAAVRLPPQNFLVDRYCEMKRSKDPQLVEEVRARGPRGAKSGGPEGKNVLLGLAAQSASELTMTVSPEVPAQEVLRRGGFGVFQEAVVLPCSPPSWLLQFHAWSTCHERATAVSLYVHRLGLVARPFPDVLRVPM